MAAPLRHKGLRVVASLLIVAGVVAFWVLRPLTETDMSVGDFTPLRDDRLAALFAPVVQPHTLYGKPDRLLYRMARNTAGETHIAYHPVYNDEQNPHSGFGATMSRLIYTGGLRIKDIMFGLADIELIEVVLDSQRTAIKIAYEDADRYNPKSFSVRHLPRTFMNPPRPFCFTTASWNHMFSLQPPASCSQKDALTPEYFIEAEWQKYKMVKKTEAILRRNRMHRVYERAEAQRQ
jgi:hypothetical protein